jgi:hypothetical protein
MPSHELHRKWAERFGITEISTEVDSIIDDRSHHDAVNTVLNYGADLSAVLELFEGKTLSKIIESFLRNRFLNKKTQRRAERFSSEGEGVRITAEIRDRYGIEGLRAMVCHIALDYIEQLYLRNRSTEEISRRIRWGKKGERLYFLLREANLECLYRHVDGIIGDISKRKEPSQRLIFQWKEDERLRKTAEGIDGYIFVDSRKYPPLFAIKKIKAEIKKIKKGNGVRVGIALNRWTVFMKHGYGIPKGPDGEYIDARKIREEIHSISTRLRERYLIERHLMPQVGFQTESLSDGSIKNYHTLEFEIFSFGDLEIVLNDLNQERQR